ncbi:MAG TPA: DUF397 domain-containing protein [Spirillospora sp.]
MGSYDETPHGWRRSTRCGASNGCVEVARRGDGAICVRDTENTAACLAFGAVEWRAFTDRVKEGLFDRP